LFAGFYEWVRYRLPAALRLVAPHSVRYKSFSLKNDEEFGKYNEARARHPVKLVLLDWLRHEALLGPKFSILDVGCGPGVFTAALFADPEIRERIEYTGVDQSERAIEYAGKTWPQARFERRDILQAGLPERDFDVIMINEVVEHLPDFSRAIDIAVARKPKIFVLTAFAVLPELGRHRVRWSPHGECYMNSYAWSKVHAKLRGVAAHRPLLMVDLGSHDFDRHWFPKKAMSMFYLRLGAETSQII